MGYIIAVKGPETRHTMEEYNGGNTIAEARREAAFFVEHCPKARIRICTVDESTDDCKLVTKEVVQEGEA